TKAKAPEGSASASEKKSDSEKSESAKSESDKGSASAIASASASAGEKRIPSVAAKKIIEEKGLDINTIGASGKDGRITKQDVLAAIKSGTTSNGRSTPGLSSSSIRSRDTERSKMSMLRRKVSQRLVAVKNETAMLTTFNEADMTEIMAIRKLYKEKFKEKHGVGLGFMSFFTKAVTESLKIVPQVNSMIDGEEVISHNYADIGIAVSAPKGLMVPVIRNAESMTFSEIELSISQLAAKARDGKLSLEEMTGGTFTISNGGVFGSMMSTPILNPPQSAILGMHNIVQRPVAVDGKVEIRPMMYLALSYDHRIIDGRESVTFLVNVKQLLEDPVRLMFGNKNPNEVMLGL
ncbi:MAG: 2-oxoglutarate dehydrogenase complex dihydrolipoyllysine-residue succinyltransferase, partial [Bacteroidia bacterium]|nr:2-oxoglutarate dehydrogenase complex dihydrolipoyllysine-residue succinyltransferase [Bacteroidia bacterium]